MIYLALIVAALILALFEEFRLRGQSLEGWAVVLISIALLMGKL